MKAHFWLIVAGTVLFWWIEYMNGIWFLSDFPLGGNHAEGRINRILIFVQDFALFASFIIGVFAHSLFVVRSPKRDTHEQVD